MSGIVPDHWDDRIAALMDGVEAGYSNDPADHGGATCWGITEATARAFGYQGDMRDLSKDRAAIIYRSRFVVQPQWDKLGAVDDALAGYLFDAGVNQGAAMAGKFLQRALNVMNRGGTDWPDLAVDGLCGAMTRYALQQCYAKRGDEGRRVVRESVRALRGAGYIEIAEGNSSQEKYEFGWLATRAFPVA